MDHYVFISDYIFFTKIRFKKNQCYLLKFPRNLYRNYVFYKWKRENYYIYKKYCNVVLIFCWTHMYDWHDLIHQKKIWFVDDSQFMITLIIFNVLNFCQTTNVAKYVSLLRTPKWYGMNYRLTPKPISPRGLNHKS